MKKYIFFDLDGTLLDTCEGITAGVAYAAKELLGIDANPENLLHFIGPPLRDEFMRTFGVTAAAASDLLAAYRRYYSVTGLYLNTPYDGIFDTVRRLNEAGYTSVIATSKPTVYSEKALEKHGYLPLFALVSGCNLDGSRESKSDVIRYALSTLSVSPDEVFMVGDRKYDMVGAKETGLTPIGVTWGFGSREELEAHGAQAVFDTPAALEAYFLSLL